MTRFPFRSRKSRRLAWLLLALAATIGLTGYYGPWVAHPAAGLVVIGLDLAEYVKFLPRLASGQIAVQREVFYLPLVTGSITASLLASRRCLPGWLRWILAIAAAPLALAMLPPAWSPGLLRLQEFRIQIIALGLCLMLIPGIVVTRHLPDWIVLAIVAIFALLSAIGPTWAFLQVRGGINYVYKKPPALGWGLWVGFLGFFTEAFLATAELLRPSHETQSRNGI
jgi:hypothetical protein